MDALDSTFAPATDLLALVTTSAALFADRLGERGTAAKSDASPVTAADLAVQALIVAGLRERYGAGGMPGGGSGEIVGEESTAIFAGAGGAALRTLVHELVRSVRPEFGAQAIDDAIDAGSGAGHADRQWIIDPIDGTRGYLSGQQYCVCLAYLERGVVRYGGAGCPRLGPRGTIFAAAQGSGTWAWDGLQRGTDARRVSARRAVGTTLTASESTDATDRARSRLRRLAEGLAPAFVARPMESQCKFVLVASGEVDLAVRFPPRDPLRGKDMVWDYAGAVVMAEEAGAAMTDCHGAPLRFGAGRSIDGNHGVLCAAPWVHSAAIDRMRLIESESESPSGPRSRNA